MQETPSGKRTNARSNDAKEFDSPRLRDVPQIKFLREFGFLNLAG
jgi:hypothetical protein